MSVNKFVRMAPACGDCIRPRRSPGASSAHSRCRISILKPRELIYPTSTVLFYTPQMPNKKATSKRKAKQRDEDETLAAAPAESPAPSARRSARSTIHLDDDGARRHNSGDCQRASQNVLDRLRHKHKPPDPRHDPTKNWIIL